MGYWPRIGVGLLVSTIGGWLLLWIVVDKWLWPRVGGKPSATGSHLTSELGIVERALYTLSLLAGQPEWIGVWLVMKTVVHWQAEGGIGPVNLGGRNNLWLIGNGLSVAIGYVGAWVVRHLPAA